MNAPDLTLHQIAPVIGAILEERKTWETMADAFDCEGDKAAAVTARGHARAVDLCLKRVIEVAAGREEAA